MKNKVIYLLLVMLSACQLSPQSRFYNAEQIATSAHMEKRDITAAPFLIRSYERVDNPAGKQVRVYIEGDGMAWVNRETPSLDPMPIHPVALELAKADDGANVIYLARPCQFNRTADGSCSNKYWTSARFAPEIIQSMSATLDEIKGRYGFTKIDLVGFSGGGAVAVLLAAQRNDISTIRTVAGNLDIDKFSEIHNVAPLDESLNPANYAGKIAAIPQLHFIGGDDDVIPKSIFERFLKASGDPGCIHFKIIPAATHQSDWAKLWPELLKQKL